LKLPVLPIPEIDRSGRTVKAWRQQVLAYFDTTGVSNDGTEAINLIVEKVRRLAHGASEISSNTKYGSCWPPQVSAGTENTQTMPNSRESESQHRRVAAQRRRSPSELVSVGAAKRLDL
jgi:hypothetical protein